MSKARIVKPPYKIRQAFDECAPSLQILTRTLFVKKVRQLPFYRLGTRYLPRHYKTAILKTSRPLLAPGDGLGRINSAIGQLLSTQPVKTARARPPVMM